MASDETEDLRGTAAAVLRMNATVLDRQAKVLDESAEELRRQADRIEHGREAEELREPREVDEEARLLPELRRMHGQWRTDMHEGKQHEIFTFEPELWVIEWLRQFHEVVLRSSRFVALYNRLAAGRPPSFELANELASAVREGT